MSITIPPRIEGMDIALLVPDLEERKPLIEALRSVGIDPDLVRAVDWTATSVEVFALDEHGKRIYRDETGEIASTTRILTWAEREAWQRGLRELGIIA